MRQIRMLRAMWRELETGLRQLLPGHEGGTRGHRQGAAYGNCYTDSQQCISYIGKRSGRKFPILPSDDQISIILFISFLMRGETVLSRTATGLKRTRS